MTIPERPCDVLIVDDDGPLRAALRLALQGAGYRVREAGDGRTALGEVALASPDAIILDGQLPDITGLEVLRALRPMCFAPVLVLTAGSDEEGRVAALDAGADDCLGKPFGQKEILARLRALLRRSGAVVTNRVVRHGPVEIDFSAQWVTLEGRPVKLTVTEYQLLTLLVSNPDKVMTHRKILRQLWGPAAEDRVHYVRTYMARLRSKLGPEFDAAGYLQSESGVGYRFVSNPMRAAGKQSPPSAAA